MYVGEGPILPAALPRHSSSTCIQSREVLPKLKFQPSYLNFRTGTNFVITVAAHLRFFYVKFTRKVMPHIFSQKLFGTYERHAQYNWMFIHFIFPLIHLRLRPCAASKEGLACPPCTSSFPVHVAMSSLHESPYRLRTLSHALHPSMAPTDENLMAPDHGLQGE